MQLERLDDIFFAVPEPHVKPQPGKIVSAPDSPQRLDRRGLPAPSWWPGAVEAARSSVSAMTEIQPPQRR